MKKSMRHSRSHEFVFSILAVLLVSAASTAADRPVEKPQHVLFINGFNEDEDLAEPMGLYFDARRGEIYVADTGNGRICVFSGDGMPLVEYKSYRDLEKTVNFVSPVDVAVNSDGIIFVSDTFLGKVVAMDFRGNLKFETDLTAAATDRISPGRIAVDDEDNLFIADGTNSQVLVYSKTGDFKYKFGRKLKGGITGIDKVNAIYPDRKNSVIYVTSSLGYAVLIFDYDGYQIGSFGVHDSGEPNFSFPSGIAALPDGTVYVADTLRSDVKVYDSSGSFLLSFGGVGFSGGAVVYPADLDLSPDGRLFVLEKTMARVHIFSVTGAGGAP